MLASREGLIPITCGSNVPQEHFANPHQQAAHCTQCHAPSHCSPVTCTTLRKEKPKEMLNVSEQLLVNVYCFSLRNGIPQRAQQDCVVTRNWESCPIWSFRLLPLACLKPQAAAVDSSETPAPSATSWWFSSQ